MATTWRLAAGNTHLYPGARLRCLDQPGPERFGTGDRVVLEFADGNVVLAALADVQSDHATLAVPPFETLRGARVAARRWQLVPAPRSGELRVAGRAA